MIKTKFFPLYFNKNSCKVSNLGNSRNLYTREYIDKVPSLVLPNEHFLLCIFYSFGFGFMEYFLNEQSFLDNYNFDCFVNKIGFDFTHRDDVDVCLTKGLSVSVDCRTNHNLKFADRHPDPLLDTTYTQLNKFLDNLNG